MPDCILPLTQCRWILTYTVDWGCGEISTNTLFVNDKSDLLYRVNDAILCSTATLKSFAVMPNPAYEQSRQS